MKKKIGLLVLAIVLIGAAKFYYDVNLNYNFKAITEGKVYKSGVIPPDELEDYISEHNIKSVIDLRYPGTNDLINNPEIPEQLTREKEAIEKIDNVNYYNVGSRQVPDQPTVDKFLEIMDNDDNYPVLIHCYHGEGRAPLFSAIYQMEYEDMPNEEARDKTRVLLKWSSFDDGKPKGEYLKNYKPRSSK
ncbi:dual specificity protein phosphatase family protein [Winogradskyella helgolandensis]|uniref:dual specificity protein phosphatase family protein n=1 Tax=Winogradskyella helgolandensis TaxID=2697010 RepID=UPI0015C80A68|nr:dual specificity protein phosphatase family protein [Winogradskyella helgolandensis]